MTLQIIIIDGASWIGSKLHKTVKTKNVEYHQTPTKRLHQYLSKI